jgi:hypothetical protein
MVSERQLHLFKGKRGRAAPPPREFLLHVALADTVRRWIMPTWRFVHLPFGERRDPVTAGRLLRMGTAPGYPDFLFTGPNASVFWLELKRPGSGRLSEAQQDIAAHLMACGFSYLCTDDLKDAVDTLKDLGILRSNIQVQ